MLYDDDKKLAHYTGGAKLVRDKMTVTSQELRAFFKQDQDKKDDDSSSLDRVFADGDVIVKDVRPDRTRTGTAPHAEFYADDNKLILNGGKAQMVDSVKGTTVGEELTYFNDDDQMLVKGEKKAPGRHAHEEEMTSHCVMLPRQAKDPGEKGQAASVFLAVWNLQLIANGHGSSEPRP